MTAYPITTTVVVDGVEAYCQPEDLADGEPTVLDGLSLQWGRDSLVDQPESGTCTFTIREQTKDGQASILQAARTGASVEVWAATDDGATGANTQQWNLAEQTAGADLPTSLWADTRPGTPMRVFMSSDSSPYARCRPSPLFDNWAGGVVFPPAPFSSATGAWDHVQRIMPGQQWRVTLEARMPSGGNGGILYVLLTSDPARTGRGAVAPLHADYIPSDGAFHTVTGTITLPEHWDDPEGAWVLPGAYAINVPQGSYYIDVRSVSTEPTAETTREVLVWAGEVATVNLSPAGDHAVQAEISAIDITASLDNITVGDEPWPIQTVAERATRIVDLAEDAGHKAYELLVDDHLDQIRVQRRDVDAQPAQGLLHDLATSGGATLWPAASAARGGYLWMEDPQSRRSMWILTVAADGTGVIVDAPAGSVANMTAGDVLRDPVTWSQDPSTVSNSIDVTWIQAFGRDPETGELVTVEKTVTGTDYDLVDEFGLRKYSVQTELAYAADAVALCALLLWQAGGAVWRFTGLAIDTSVLLRDPIDGGPTQTERLTTVMDLLDGRLRIGKAVEISDMPVWTPGGTTTGLFIEGGTYTIEDHQWQLELQATPAEGQGHSVVWDEVPPELSWDEMNDITWDDLHGVGV